MGGDDLERLDRMSSTEGASLSRLEPESSAEAEEAFAALADGGEVLMALQEVDWAEKHGSFIDRVGIRWMVDYPGDVGAE
ncbi:VOC family protein [Natronobiforma cellulositropha]|uniref:hypothetical protein n=1 Tax=Natronobiforma cellulositropha TaxID=1679076 RepID=UPI0021D60B96|nr:hypothetical protein [Natronobiforma cellulositropha]